MIFADIKKTIDLSSSYKGTSYWTNNYFKNLFIIFND